MRQLLPLKQDLYAILLLLPERVLLPELTMDCSVGEWNLEGDKRK